MEEEAVEKGVLEEEDGYDTADSHTIPQSNDDDDDDENEFHPSNDGSTSFEEDAQDDKDD